MFGDSTPHNTAIGLTSDDLDRGKQEQRCVRRFIKSQYNLKI